MNRFFSERREGRSHSVTVTALSLLGLVLACAAIPSLLAASLHPSAGVAGCFVSFWIWARFGPPPGPGFGSGIASLTGLGLILGFLISFTVATVQAFFE